jgi:hypothetical protein
MVVAALAVEAGAAFSAGQWFELPTAAALAAAAGFAWGTAKLAFDGLLQANVPHARRGAAFTRSETLFAIAWVLGAVVPTALPMPTGLGLALAGFAALGRPDRLRRGAAGSPRGPRRRTSARRPDRAGSRPGDPARRRAGYLPAAWSPRARGRETGSRRGRQ